MTTDILEAAIADALYFAPSTGGFYSNVVHAQGQIPGDAVEITPELHADLMAAQGKGQVITAGKGGQPFAADPAPPTPAQVRADLTSAVQGHLDAQAKALGYDSIATAVTYADEPAVPRFQAQGLAFRAWRSNVWEACIVHLAAVTAGTAPVPTAAELIAALPVFVAP